MKDLKGRDSLMTLVSYMMTSWSKKQMLRPSDVQNDVAWERVVSAQDISGSLASPTPMQDSYKTQNLNLKRETKTFMSSNPFGKRNNVLPFPATFKKTTNHLYGKVRASKTSFAVKGSP